MSPGQNSFILVCKCDLDYLEFMLIFVILAIFVDHASTNQQPKQAFEDFEPPSTPNHHHRPDGGHSPSDTNSNNNHKNSFVRFSPESLNFGHQ